MRVQLTDTSRSLFAESALRYAELGYPVFRLAPRSKVPLAGSNGHLEAATDAATIEEWWIKEPLANIGIATQGLIVLDIDGADNPWLREEPDLQMDFMSAYEARTPRGGRHLLWRQIPGRPVRNSEGVIAPNIDIRADGGYIVAAPSVTPVGRYAWVSPGHLDVGPNGLAEAPPWLVELATAKKAPGIVHIASGGDIFEGYRDSTLTSLAGTMRRRGMTVREINAALQQTNLDRCKPPLEESQVTKIANSIGSKSPHPASVPQASPSPFGGDDVPSALIPFRELRGKCRSLRPPVIDGLLRQGEIMNVVAAPKSRKSWLANDAALAVATGRPWLGQYATIKGNVLLIDNELHEETSADRIPLIARSRGISLDELDETLFVQNVRGSLVDIMEMRRFFQAVQPGKFSLVILDALYRFMPRGFDENDNGAMASIYNALDEYAQMLGCSFLLVHHTSKGSQANKSVTDVGAGAGSQSRAADTHLVLRPHAVVNAVTLEATTRSWPPIDPVVLRWGHPVWNIDSRLDPRHLKESKPPKKADGEPHTPESFTKSFVTAEPATTEEIKAKATGEGVTGRQAASLLKLAESNRLVYRWTFGGNRPVKFATLPQSSKEGR
jgi:Bifunctional DNA primase/polymerase, N-terminal/AAA domain/Primase C terminal 1 (PriCT-1)